MPDPKCVNLMARFGDRYKIGFDPCYDPKHRPREKYDSWMMVVLCERGAIHPYGGNLLAVEVENRPVTANRLRELDCTTLAQEGDYFAAFTFNVADFIQIAEIVKPRRRRRLSAAQKREAANRLRDYQFKARSPSHSQRPETHANGPTRLQGHVGPRAGVRDRHTYVDVEDRL